MTNENDTTNVLSETSYTGSGITEVSFLYGVQFLSVNKQHNKMGGTGMHATVIMAES